MKAIVKKVSLLFLLQLCLIINPALAEGITVIVPSESRVEGPVITLAQIANIIGDDNEAIKSLGQLKLGSAPFPGSNMLLTREMLGMRLAATGVKFHDITWIIPDTVKIVTNSQSVSGQVLTQTAMAAIYQQIGQSIKVEDRSVAVMGNVADVTVPVGKIALSVDLPYGIRYNAPTTVMITITVNGQVFTKVGLKFDVKLYQQAVVAAAQISPGEMLTAGNLRYERMDQGRLGIGYFTDINKMLGLAAKRPLTPGMVVTDSMVNKPLLIKRGNMVTIIARIGNLEVTAAGQAMQEGTEDQLIRVKNISSSKIISAKVIGEGTVEVLTPKSNGH